MAEGALGNIGNTAASTIGTMASDPIGTLSSFVSDPTQEIDLGLGIANPSPAGIVSSIAGRALGIPALGFVGPALGLASVIGDAFGPSTGTSFGVGQQTGSGVSQGQVSGYGTATGGPTGLGINAYGQEVDPNAEMTSFGSPGVQMGMSIADDISAGMSNAPGATDAGLGSIGATTNSQGTTSVSGQSVDTGSAFGGDAPSQASQDVADFAEAHGQEVGPGGDGGGGGDGTVICTELHRQGILSKDIYLSDQEFGRKLAIEDPEAFAGYHAWAIPVVSLMKKSFLFTKFVALFALPWAREMHFIEAGVGKGSILGKFMIKFGVPICRFIGRRSAKELCNG